MNSKFILWASILISCLITLGLVMRLLSLQHIPLSETLVLRGASCLILVVAYSRRHHLSLIPSSFKTQFFRALIAGSALSLFAMSYKWLTASAVSVLSNIDVPLLIVLGPLIGIQASKSTRILSIISIAFLIWYVLALESQGELLYGLSSLMAGCLLLCFGYRFIEKSMQEENRAITILTPALALIFYGLIEWLILSHHEPLWTYQLFFLDIFSGIAMFGAYVATMHLYSITDLASAEFTTLIASIIIQPIEALFFHVNLEANYLLSSIGFVIMTYFILTYQNKVANAT